MAASSERTDMKTIRVWDLPTRVFHWLFAASVVGSFITVKIGGDAMDWHARFGYLALSLLMFRIVWGFIGPVHARFSSFVKGPAAIMEMLRGRPWQGLGHNPLGAISVLAMIAAFTTQAILGLFTTDDILFDGPMVKHVSNAWVEFASRWHHRAEWLLVGLVALHIMAIIVHRVARGHDLVKPMITGDVKVVDASGAQGARDDLMMRARAIVVMALAAAVVAYLSR